MKHISILGCGWLGMALAKRLVEEEQPVKGSTTTSEKLERLSGYGVEPYLIRLSPQINEDYDHTFFDAHTLILNLPVEDRQDIDQFLPHQIEVLINLIHRSPVQHIVFLSSVNVYPNLNTVVTERDVLYPESKKAKALIEAERLLQMQPDFNTTVIRMAGMFGKGRHPGGFLANQKNLKNGEAPVNLVHLEDCVNIICKLLKVPSCRGEVFNVCAPRHPKRSDFFRKAALNGGYTPPTFLDDKHRSFKIVSSDKVQRLLKYKFVHENPKKLFEVSAAD
ncbi:MAG: SDR family NAD(P)-dependent oxidoreductase [Cytophagales bacterium]|nr:SDR family NAD(P)-dependent oxidoreductase [Cytophagales bacterium]